MHLLLKLIYEHDVLIVKREIYLHEQLKLQYCGGKEALYTESVNLAKVAKHYSIFRECTKSRAITNLIQRCFVKFDAYQIFHRMYLFVFPDDQ